MSDERHVGEELQDLLDGRLTEPRRSDVEHHVAHCARCRRELDALRWVKAELRKHREDVEAPGEISSLVRAALDAEDKQPRRGAWPRRAWIAGVLAAAAVLVLFTRGHKSEPLPSLVAADYVAHTTGAVPLSFRSSDPEAIVAYFARSGVPFHTRVFDLGMMQYRLEGGRVHRLGGRTSALFTYRGPADRSLVCQMYEGRVSELPASDDVRQNNGITFRVYQSNGVTLVFWQEGGLVCVLASNAPLEEVVQLAFAKAVRVEAGS